MDIDKFFIIFLLTAVNTTTSFFITTPKCGSAFYTRTGTFSSPSYRAPNGSTNGTEVCEWRITSGIDEKIVLNITNIDIIKSPNCSRGFVEVRDGYWYSSPLLGRVCGSGRLDPIISTGNKMYVSYNYYNPNGHRGFIANYEAICGGDLFVENSTQFFTPNYPEQYPLNKKCIWRIVVPDFRLAVLTFESFDVEYQSNCLYDYVEIREGLTEDSNLLANFCSPGSRFSEMPTQIISSTSYLYVKFVSDISIQKGGFLATIQNDYNECLTEINDCAQICINTVGSYRCDCRSGYELHSNGKDCEVACGGILNSTRGSIHSPSYPDVYPVNRNCTWDIIAEPHYVVNINFIHFNIEDGGNNETCDNDFLNVYNSLVNASFTLEGSYCGDETPLPITSQSNALRLIFSSDSSVQWTGFLLNYTIEMDQCTINNGNCFHGCNKSSNGATCQCLPNYSRQTNNRDCASGCNFEISSTSGNVKSPSYPSSYGNSQNCRWLFKTTPGHRLRVVFQTFTLENQATCNYDDVTFYDGLSTSNRTLGKFCGSSVPSPVTSSTNELQMTFKSDGSNVFQGFFATYSSVCGGQLLASDERRYIYSHADFGYANYRNNVSCDWVISSTRSATVVSLSFANFHLEDNCQNDYVEVLDGSNSNSTSLGKFCGSAKPHRIISTNSVVTVRFRSNSALNDKGFSLVYQAVLNGTINLSTDLPVY